MIKSNQEEIELLKAAFSLAKEMTREDIEALKQQLSVMGELETLKQITNRNIVMTKMLSQENKELRQMHLSKIKKLEENFTKLEDCVQGDIIEVKRLSIKVNNMENCLD